MKLLDRDGDVIVESLSGFDSTNKEETKRCPDCQLSLSFCSCVAYETQVEELNFDD